MVPHVATSRVEFPANDRTQDLSGDVDLHDSFVAAKTDKLR